MIPDPLPDTWQCTEPGCPFQAYYATNPRRDGGPRTERSTRCYTHRPDAPRREPLTGKLIAA